MGRYLVCYFSPTGTTKKVGELIADATGADRWEIRPMRPYSKGDLDWTRRFSRCNREHRRKKLPVIDNPIYTAGDYGIVFLGFPIWYETAPNIILNFLKMNDWTGQKIVLFATSGGSGISAAREDIRAFLKGKGEIPAAGILDPSDPEKVKGWAWNAIDVITGADLSAAEKYVRGNYTGTELLVKEDRSLLNGQEKEQFVKYSRDIEPKYGRDPEQPGPGTERPRRSPYDRYNSGAIERAMRSTSAAASGSTLARTLNAFTDQSFVGKLTELIREKGLKEPEVYRAAQIDRKLFSKINSDQDYKPSKDTCVALAYALKLSLPEANDLLSRAGYVLSHSSLRDVILEYFFSAGRYNLFDINEVLLQLNQRPLGRQL